MGAGGISYALRSIPDMMRVAAMMREVAPDAWLINFTNPAGMVTEALSAVLGTRVIGICDSASGLVTRAARAAGMDLRGTLAGVDYVGLNHLGWLRRLDDGEKDHLPGLLADPLRLGGFEEGRLFGPDLLRVLGALPNEYLFYYYFHREALRSIGAADRTRGRSCGTSSGTSTRGSRPPRTPSLSGRPPGSNGNPAISPRRGAGTRSVTRRISPGAATSAWRCRSCGHCSRADVRS